MTAKEFAGRAWIYVAGHATALPQSSGPPAQRALRNLGLDTSQNPHRDSSNTYHVVTSELRVADRTGDAQGDASVTEGSIPRPVRQRPVLPSRGPDKPTSAPVGCDAAGHAFISYVREDAKRVDKLQRSLEAEGITVWRDTSDLWPGQDWKIEIRRAIERGVAFIACFSEHTTRRRTVSYQNEELVFAVELMRQRPPGEVWLLPVRFSDCQLPSFNLGVGRTLDSLHRVDLLNDSWEPGISRLAEAVLRIVEARSQSQDGATAGRRSRLDEGRGHR